MRAMSIPLVFMGSDPISCHFLRALADAEDMDVRLVVTKPDVEQGRRVQRCAVRQMVADAGLPLDVFMPERLNEDASVTRIAAAAPQVVVVVAYGKLLGSRILSMPPLGCLNIHMSLLPALRGADPITRAILGGLPETGVTAMRMERGLDSGPVYAQRSTPVRPDDNHDTLAGRLTALGVPLMLETIRALRDGAAVATVQDESRATLAPKRSAEEWMIDWGETAEQVDRRVRAFSPRPSCTAYLPPSAELRGQPLPSDPARLRALVGPVLKVSGVEVLPGPAPEGARPSQIVAIEKKGVVVATGRGCVRLTQVRPFGKPRTLSGPEFVNGYRNKLRVGDKLYPVLQTPWD